MEMEMEKKRGHVLAVTFPSQGHITPIHQFCKRLYQKSFKTTLTLTTSIFNTIHIDPSSPVSIARISDGYDNSGFSSGGSVLDFLQNFKTFGSKSVADIIRKHQTSDDPITCIVYDSFLPWALDLAREFGLPAAAFFTHSCSVNYINYLFYKNQGSLKLPIQDLTFLELQDLPTFVTPDVSHLAYSEMVLQQFTNFDKADFILVNTFQELDLHEEMLLSKVCPVLTIGPTVPSMYLDQQIKSDNDYDLNLFDSKEAALCTTWLNTKPQGSVVYIAFGSMAQMSSVQMKELASAVTNFSFMWVVGASEEENLPLGFLETLDKDKGLVLKWSPQLQVLSNRAIGCFMTHCGWNSTIEALTLGVPMVFMPQWMDQPMNAKYIQDVWKVGVRVKAEKESGIAKREEIEFSIGSDGRREE
ncbi:unnamed protein product [Microthlaspi erraticum]|uniref:Glycosyltransferase n=1 Tax=Microthlaspi erraticum TaxID=1685480 RepID=A0A6D2KNA3_9BRAS|nr:unnamed protein product [Microthlaspi erraticum]